MATEISQLSLGMKFKHPSQLREMEYSLMLNGGIMTSAGDILMLSSEASNLLCSRFKEGYKVVGDPRPIHSLGITFWFLANEAEGKSEIAVIKNSFNRDTQDLTTNCKDCSKQLILDKPLEEIEQIPSCDYTTFVNANCLGFSLNNPIRSWAKVDDCNVTLYFVQKEQEPRYINYPDYQKELYENPSGDIGCPHIETSSLDCDRIKIFKDACNPELTFVDVVSGGSNTAGTLQFGVQYADAYGNAITNSFYFTNKIDIWDKSKTIITDTAYTVAKSVKIHIDGLNPNFDWFNLIVLKTVKGVTTPYLVNTFSNTGVSFDYTYLGIDKNLKTQLSIEEVLKRNPIYDEAQIIFESNGILGLGDLEEPRILNLQPVINKLNVFWETVQLEEGDYQNPILAAKYMSGLRDEVTALAIEFQMTNTARTARFHIPGRSPSGYDLEDVTLLNGVPNPDVFNSSVCESPSGYNPRWTVYNTGTNLGAACGQGEVEGCDNIELAYASCNTGTFYQNINTLEYFLDANLTVPLPDPCSHFSCESPSGDCFSNINTQYPGNLEITSIGCNPIITSRGECLQVPHYNPNGNVPNDVPYPNPSGDPQNIDCLNAVELGQYPCSNSTQTSYVSKLNNSPEKLWYSFTAAQSGMVINLVSSYNIGHSNNFIVTLYQAGSPAPCTSPNLISSQTTANPYLLFENLITGATYFITIEATTNTIQGDDDYYYICQSVPLPEYYTEECTPNTLTLRCDYEIQYCVKADPCNAQIYEYGNMAYWESTELYPCLPEVWGDLANTPIRHHKFPDCKITPHFKNNKGLVGNNLYDVKNNIYPIGIRIDIEQIKGLLQEAVDRGLITHKERLSICSYRIFRGNRRGNESVIAKGWMNDVWKYRNNIYKTETDILYPNYSYNPQTPDLFNRFGKINNSIDAVDNFYNPLRHPYQDAPVPYVNNKYVFHSPNTHFNNPGLGSEIKLELEGYGISEGRFTEAINHAKYQYTGVGMFQAAWGFAAAESFVETVQLVSQSTSSYAVLGSFVSINYILAAVSVNIGAPGIQFGHYYEWLELLQKFAPYQNYAWYFTSIGKYTDYTTTNIVEGNIRRGLNDAQYINSGIVSVKDGAITRQLNNYKRESSVYLNLNRVTSDTSKDSTFLPTSVIDNSRWYPGDGSPDTQNCSIGDVRRPISSYYSSIKNYLPSQFGQVDQIDYVDTGYSQSINWSSTQDSLCTPIFGGDTFINRFYLRTQFPFYIQDRIGYPPNSDVSYGELGNVGYPQFFMNYPPGNDIGNSSNAIWGNVAMVGDSQADYSLACFGWTGEGLYTAGLVTGILSAIAAGTSLSIGLGITYGVVAGIIDAQTVGHPTFIRGKHFLYAYGEPGYIVESDYNLDLRYGTNQKEGNFYPNVGDMVSWTQPKTQEDNLINFDNTYNYNRDYSSQNNKNAGYVLPPAFSQEKEDCKVSHPNRVIYSLQDIDNNDRFDGNQVFLTNSFRDFNKGSGKLVNVIGFSNNKVLILLENQYIISNAYSTLEADIKNVAVGSGSLFDPTLFQYQKTDLGDGGSQIQAYTSTKSGIFYVDNKRGEIYNCVDVPRSIIQSEESQWFKENLPFKIKDYFPDYNIDNSLKGAGMSITYDSKFERVFFSKKDYAPKPEYANYITFDGTNFHYKDLIIFPEDTAFFCDKSWTIAYSPLTKSFISFYSFVPDGYNSLPGYFQTFYNTGDTGSLWNHNLTNKSYGVFQGIKYPFIFEYALKSKGVNQQLQDVSFYSEARRWQDNFNYGVNPNLTFDYSLIYNATSTSGNLELIPKVKNSLYQWSQFNSGKVVGNKTQILVENVDNKWSINTFSNISLNNSLPITYYPCNQPFMKEVNPDAISYTPKFIPNNFYSDYYVIRLGNISDSIHQYIARLELANQTPIQ